MSDLQTMIWKEWQEMVQSTNGRSKLTSISVMLLVISVLMPLQQREAWLQGGAVVVWMVAPLLMLPQTIADTFAGERERHTLESLLATRLPDRAILFGKVATPVIGSWMLIQVAMLMALIPISLINAAVQVYSLPTLLTGLIFSALTSVLVGSAGVLISLRASSVQQAQQMIGVITLSVVFIPIAGILIITLLPAAIQEYLAQIIQSNNLFSLIAAVMFLFVLLDVSLLWLADRRFRRNQLILD